MPHRTPSAALLLVSSLAVAQSSSPTPTEWTKSPFFAERVRVLTPDDEVRVALNAPAEDGEAKDRPTRLVLFANPNGNTIEQTLGCAKAEGLDWHYDIQHVAAQVRRLRALERDETLVLACAEAAKLSWPAWRKAREDNAARIRAIVDEVADAVPGGKTARITLSCHSGGGSFLFGFLDGGDDIPERVDRIVFLDANYSFDADKHTQKLLTWLRRAERNRLVVIAYDDREIVLDGKKVVGPTGGTWRACDRMLASLRDAKVAIDEAREGPFETYRALDGRIALLRHVNPDNKILHTVLVGEMNGLLHALTLGTEHEKEWGTFGGSRAYVDHVQPKPGIGVEIQSAK